jgi:hypothetical protein
MGGLMDVSESSLSLSLSLSLCVCVCLCLSRVATISLLPHLTFLNVIMPLVCLHTITSRCVSFIMLVTPSCLRISLFSTNDMGLDVRGYTLHSKVA